MFHRPHIVAVQIPMIAITFLFFALTRRVKEQSRFPEYTRNHAILFLHACYWDVTAAKSALERYATIRGNASEIFDARDPLLPSCQQIFNVA